MTMDQQFVEFVVKALVSQPEEVQVERTIDEKGVLLELTVDPSDLGRVIGKRGNTAQSIRTLLRALGTKNDARYNLKIVDNGEETPRNNNSEVEQKDNEAHESTEAPAASGNQWAHLSSADTSDESSDEGQSEEESSTESTNSVAERTKKELADLDDLNL